MQGREGRAEAWEAQFPERDASVPRRTASQQASPYIAPFENRRGRGRAKQVRGGMPSQGPGDLTWSRQTSTPVRRRREATAREDLVTGESKEDGELRTAYPSAAPNSMPAVWRRGPRLENVASGLAHRSAQHLTPLRGRPLRTEAAMEREGASTSALRTTLEARASSYGPEDPALPDLPPGRPGGKQPRRGGHTHTPPNDHHQSPSQKHVPGLNRDQRNQRFRHPAFNMESLNS